MTSVIAFSNESFPSAFVSSIITRATVSRVEFFSGCGRAVSYTSVEVDTPLGGIAPALTCNFLAIS